MVCDPLQLPSLFPPLSVALGERRRVQKGGPPWLPGGQTQDVANKGRVLQTHFIPIHNLCLNSHGIQTVAPNKAQVQRSPRWRYKNSHNQEKSFSQTHFVNSVMCNWFLLLPSFDFPTLNHTSRRETLNATSNLTHFSIFPLRQTYLPSTLLFVQQFLFPFFVEWRLTGWLWNPYFFSVVFPKHISGTALRLDGVTSRSTTELPQHWRGKWWNTATSVCRDLKYIWQNMSITKAH